MWVNIFIILVNPDPFVSAWNSLGSPDCFLQFLLPIVYVRVSTGISLLKLTLSLQWPSGWYLTFKFESLMRFGLHLLLGYWRVWWNVLLWKCILRVLYFISTHVQKNVVSTKGFTNWISCDIRKVLEAASFFYWWGVSWKTDLEEDVVSALTQRARITDLSSTGRGPSEVVTNVALICLGSMEISKELCSLHTSYTINFTS